MKRIALATLLASTAFAAQAADLPRRSAPIAAPVYSAPLFTWTGFYAGLNAGVIFGDYTKLGTPLNPDPAFTGGAQLGYNYQIGQFVAGLEADYNYSGLRGRGLIAAANTRGELNSFGTIRGRLGVAFDRALVYGTGGWAFGNNELKTAVRSDDKWHNGYAIGGGLEYAFTQNISAKAEYIFMKFEDKTYFGGPGKAGLDANVVRAGVNYRF
jgi:outer membrane immunogenic protein